MIFRAQVIWPLLCRNERLRGDLAAAIRELAQTPVKPPGSDASHLLRADTTALTLRVPRNGLAGLTPCARGDCAYAHALSPDERKFLLQLRRENPGVAATVILNTLLADGRIERCCISAANLRRFFAQEGLDRRTLNHRSRCNAHQLERQRQQQTLLDRQRILRGAPPSSANGSLVVIREGHLSPQVAS